MNKQQNENQSENKHDTVLVEYGGLNAQIDKEIAPLILETWKADIQTIFSCQEDFDLPSHAYIQFPDIYEAEEFLKISFNNDDSLRLRISQNYPEHIWFYKTWPIIFPNNDKNEETIILWSTVVYISRFDLKTVTKNLISHNKVKNRV
ncbi:MAG: hypothetical protein QF868_05565 [Candidatus Marinimicrobia bacterium]|nr:hypothetical protein [Candidatus Neomarinimicrobiota bacterium]HJM33410.1 hypothetical protein [Candidatus Neomarinimicrobiota bacterium]